MCQDFGYNPNIASGYWATSVAVHLLYFCLFWFCILLPIRVFPLWWVIRAESCREEPQAGKPHWHNSTVFSITTWLKGAACLAHLDHVRGVSSRWHNQSDISLLCKQQRSARSSRCLLFFFINFVVLTHSGDNNRGRTAETDVVTLSCPSLSLSLFTCIWWHIPEQIHCLWGHGYVEEGVAAAAVWLSTATPFSETVVETHHGGPGMARLKRTDLNPRKSPIGKVRTS